MWKSERGGEVLSSTDHSSKLSGSSKINSRVASKCDINITKPFNSA
ncbi:hypothetical protein AVEN_98819-1, partial [Araneus ventricosus]